MPVYFSEQQNREISIKGTGQPANFLLYQAGLYVKPLQANVDNVLGAVKQVLVNTGARGTADHIPPGDDYDIVVASEISHPLANINVGDPIANITNGGATIPEKFTVVEGINDFPDINWNAFGCVISAKQSFLDSAGTEPSHFANNDAVKGVVGNLVVTKNSAVANPLFSLTQGTSSRKPVLQYDVALGVPYLFFNPFAAHALEVVAANGQTVANNSFMDSYYCVDMREHTINSANSQITMPDGVVFQIQDSGAFRVVGMPYRITEAVRTVRVKRSAAPAFGDSELWVDGVKVWNGAIYFPTVTLPAEMTITRNANYLNPSFKLFAAVCSHDGTLDPTEAAAVTTWVAKQGGQTL